MANIGIDLGTTHSLVAIVLDGTARCLLNENDESLLPSAVRYNLDGVPVAVGQPALELAPEKDGVTFTSFKRFMGRSAAEVADEAEAFGYPLVDPDGAEGAVRFDVGGRAITPVELSSYVLRLLHNRAEECLLNRPGGVVITVPAYFDDAQRQATRDAARVAGLNVLRLLNEPTAAALAYGLDHGTDGQRVVVYDLGGGTFDVSVLELNDGVYQVLATAGDTRLGGDDFDHALAGLLVNQLGYKPDGIEFRQIVRAAEQAKRDLTAASTAMLSVELRGQPIAADIDRETFETLIGPIIEKTRHACERALSDAGLTVDKIDEVVLVGGSTRVPLVRQMVEKMFGRPPHCDLNPDQVVAMGAAMQADILTGDSELAPEMLLLDVVPLSLGLEVMGGVTERLIPRASTIPASAVQTFTTHVDGQTAVELHIVQGEREMVRDNRSLAKFKLSGLPELPAGVPRVEVQFMVDADGILRVNATEQYTETSTSLEVQPTYGLSDEEIEDMLEEAIDHAETDIEERLLVDVKVESEQILHHLGKALTRDGDLLEGTEKDDIGNAVAALETAMKGNDRHRILALSRTVDEISAPFAQRRIERDLARTIGGMSTDAVADVLGFEEDKVEGPSSLA